MINAKKYKNWYAMQEGFTTYCYGKTRACHGCRCRHVEIPCQATWLYLNWWNRMSRGGMVAAGEVWDSYLEYAVNVSGPVILSFYEWFVARRDGKLEGPKHD